MLNPNLAVGGQNKFSSLPAPSETRDRNVTVYLANTCWYRCGSFCITEILPVATLFKFTDSCSQHSRTNSVWVSVT